MESFVINSSRKEFYYFSIAYTDAQKNMSKCEYNAIFFCEEGSAIIEINYQKYNITPRTTVSLAFKDVVTRLYVSKDFRGKGVAFLPSLLMMETRNYDFTFLAAIRRHPVITWEAKYARFVSQIFNTISLADEFGDDAFLTKSGVSQCICFMSMLKQYFQTNDILKEVTSQNMSSKKDYFLAFVKELFHSCRKSREVLYYANSLNISSNYLNEVSQTVCEHSAKEVIDQYVSAQLKFELYNTNKPMQQLTEEYNFPNQSYLSRYYRRIMGETPSQTRKSRNEKPISIF